MDYDINNYDCRKAYELLNNNSYYLEEQEKALRCFKSALLLENDSDFENAFIMNYRGIQLLGNAILIKLFNQKSKEKNCQFKLLFKENIINKEILTKLSFFTDTRNNIYYNNRRRLIDYTKEEYQTIKKEFEEIKIILMEKL